MENMSEDKMIVAVIIYTILQYYKLFWSIWTNL